MAEERSGFLGRWSRRKLDTLQGRALDEPALADKAKPAPVAGAAAPKPGQAAFAPAPVPAPAAADPWRTADRAGAASASPAPVTGPACNSDATSAVPDASANATLPEKTLSLEDVKALTQDSDFKPFMARDVGSDVRNAAMKKLFADPHYNVMDGLDIYIDDYSKPDPLPQAMLRQMASAKFLNLFEDEKSEKDAKDQKQPWNNTSPQERCSDAAQADPAPAPDSPNKPGAEPREPSCESSVAQSGEPWQADRPQSPSPFSADACRQLPPVTVTAVTVTRSGASQDHHAHTHLRLQPDHAAPAPSAGRGTS